MIGKNLISLVLPCRNEAKALVELLNRIPKFIDEIIVVDNLSEDATTFIAKKFKARVFEEKRHENGIGYGYALLTGMSHAKGDIIICMDGDGSYPVEKISEIIDYSENVKVDFISCNRLPVRCPQKMSKVREFGVNVLNIFVRMLFKYPIKDSLSGMWVFKKDIIPYLNLKEGGWNFSLEIKINAIMNNQINFVEYNIPYQDRVFDQSKQNLLKTGISHLLYLFKRKFFAILTVGKSKIYNPQTIT